MYRQGDVLIVPVAALPKGAKQLKSAAGRFILAEGEATGHSHSVLEHTPPTMEAALMVKPKAGAIAIQAPSWTVTAYEKDGVMYLVTAGIAEVVHQEHDAVILPPGKYRIGRQKEYSPEAIRNVAD